MVGRTNVSIGGGGGSAFLAYLQVATDPNAVITAVNLAGDTFSGTADGTGALVLNLTASGTYTVTSADGGRGTVAVIDSGETYMVEVKAFSGTFIENGVIITPFTSIPVSGSVVPTVTATIVSGENAIDVEQGVGNSVTWLTEDAVYISDYSTIEFRGYKVSQYNVFIQAFDENGTYERNITAVLTSLGNVSASLSNLDSTKKHKFGITLGSSSSVVIVSMKLQ